MAIIKLIIAYIMCLTQILTPVDAWLNAGGEDAFFTEWSVNDTFDQDDYITLEKTPGEDFVVLNLADVQLSDEKAFGDLGKYSKKLITKLVKDTQPDLITLSGDNAWDTMAYIDLIDFIDSFCIPWAPVMGNHDGQGCISEFWVAETLVSSTEYCLFRFGPKDMGYGNYIINITENGEIIHTLFMMDTHDNYDCVLEDGTVVESYDHLWPNQQAWYKWAVEGIEDMAGYKVESSAIMHIPVVEYLDAWDAVCYDCGHEECEFGEIAPEYADVAFGRKYEYGGMALENNGFFDLCKELGSTKNIIVGHDHVNDFSIPYEGIRLTYSVKSGFGSYWREDMIGGTTLSIDGEGVGYIDMYHYDLAEHGLMVQPD